MLAVGLGMRAALSRAGRGRFVALLVVGAVVCACWLIILGAASVKSREGERYERHLAVQVEEPAILGPRSTPASWRGRVISLVVMPGDGVDGAPVPPGLAAPPRAGEVRLSPALAAAVDGDRQLASWFPYDRGPDLPIEAIDSAGEYRAFIGVELEELAGSTGFAAFGGSFYDSELTYYQLLGFLLFVGAPALGLLALSGRFGRRLRRERLAALRLLGMSSPQSRLVLGLETGVPVTLGAVLAVAIAVIVRPHHLVVPIANRWVFGQDFRLGAGSLLVAGGAVAALGFALGAATPHERSATGRLRSVVARADITRAWTVALYAAGVGLVGWSWLRTQPRDPWRFVGVLLVAAGTPSAVAYACKVTAGTLRWTDGPLPWYLAMRKLMADPRSLSRLAGIVGVVMFVAGVAQPVADVIAQPNGTWVGLAREEGKSTVLGSSLSQFPVPLVLRGAPPPGTHTVAIEVGLWPVGQAAPQPPVATGLVASCADLDDLLAVKAAGCDGTIQRLVVAEDVGVAAPPSVDPLTIQGLDGQEINRVPAPRTAIRLPPEAAIFSLPELLIPPEILPGGAQAFVTDVYLRTSANAEAWEAAQGWVTGSSPWHPLEHEIGHVGADASYSWVILGFAFAAAIAALGATLSSFDEQRSAQEWASLRALGVSARSLVAIRGVVAAVSAVVTIALVTVPAVLVTDAFLRVNGDQIQSFAPFLNAAAAGTTAILTVSLVSAALQMRRLSRGALP